MDNSLFRELFEFIISIRRSLALSCGRVCENVPFARGRKGRGEERRRISRTQSRAGTWSGSLRRSPGLLLCSCGRSIRERSREIHPSSSPPLLMNGELTVVGPFQYSRRYSGSTRYRDARDTYVYTRR